MKVSEAGEFGLIADLRRMLAGGGKGEDLVCGIGDDAAVFRSRQGGLWAFTADALVEGVHFDPAYTPWHSLGFKSLAVNISDHACMGGSPPSFALITLGITEDMELADVEEMYRGVQECGGRFGCRVVGGDVVRSPRHLFVSVSLVGFIPGDRVLTRGGARPGQAVMVTGTLGDSYLGLKWLMGGGGDANPCARRHLYPEPRLAEGARAVELGASAGIDVSDGLLRDLGHICEESGVGAEVYMEKVPISGTARETAREIGEDAAGAALFGGEDYELVLVADEERAPFLRDELGLTVIGRMTGGRSVAVMDPSGREMDVGRSGYEHFKEG